MVDTETATVSGDNMYTTPKGYTLPTTGTVTGTYQWDATYNGDNNNSMASDNNDKSEQVVIGMSTISLVTTPSQSVVLQGTATCVTDTATLTGGDNPTGTVTFTLYSPSGTKLDTETVPVSGDGNYTTPKGYSLPSNAAEGIYQWNATYNGDNNNSKASDNNDPTEQVTVVMACGCINLQNVSYTDGSSTGLNTLNGNTNQGDTVSATFTVPSGQYDQLSLVSYNAVEPFFNAKDAYTQTVYQSVTEVFGPGTHTITVPLPNNFYQVDFVCGTVITMLGGSKGHYDATDFYSAQDRLISSDNGGNNAQNQSPISLSGVVFNDVNQNGKFGTGDQGINNVTVTLTGTDSYGNSITETATTGSNGAYSFTDLVAGVYTVTETQPSGYTSEGAVVGSTGGTAVGSNSITKITLGANANSTANDFSEIVPPKKNSYNW